MSTQTHFYAGIGSRETPESVLHLMARLAHRLNELGFTLRSGGATGADTAFEQGSFKSSEIYLPWQGYNGNQSQRYHLTRECFELAKQFHPAWDRCSQGAKKLHARNGQIVLGQNLDTPVDFVLCWHKNSGGTMQAVRIAQSRGIPIVNLANPNWKTTIADIVKTICGEHTKRTNSSNT